MARPYCFRARCHIHGSHGAAWATGTTSTVTAVAKNIDQFAADVKEASKGRVEVQIFGGSQLFKPTQQHIASPAWRFSAERCC